MSAYLLLFAIVLGVNLLPAFGPPTWSIVALYGLDTNLSLPVGDTRWRMAFACFAIISRPE